MGNIREYMDPKLTYFYQEMFDRGYQVPFGMMI